MKTQDWTIRFKIWSKKSIPFTQLSSKNLRKSSQRTNQSGSTVRLSKNWLGKIKKNKKPLFHQNSMVHLGSKKRMRNMKRKKKNSTQWKIDLKMTVTLLTTKSFSPLTIMNLEIPRNQEISIHNKWKDMPQMKTHVIKFQRIWGPKMRKKN